MNESTSALSAWESFYVIVGSSGAALVGIQFVVMTLIASRRQRPTAESLNAFGTPTVVHLVGTLLVSAIMSAPWRSLFPASVVLVMCGVGGIAYGAIVIRRARRGPRRRHTATARTKANPARPACNTFGALAAAFLRMNTQLALFGIGAAALGLLLIGIHNAWDTVTHIVVPDSREARKRE